ncbi:MAG: ubiquitin-like protein UBact [Nitrospiraceae bacterium]
MMHMIATLERRERPFDPIPKPASPSEEGGGPKRPETGSPDKDNLLKRMRKVDPKQAERYRQRTGQ